MPLSNENRSTLLGFAKESHNEFKNFTQSVVLPNVLVLDIENKDKLKQLITTINQMNKDKPLAEKTIVRVAAGGLKDKAYSQSYSLTPGAVGDVIVRLVGEEFQTIEVVDDKKQIVKVGASVQIGDLDEILYEKHKLCLSTSSKIGSVTMGGLPANAGHGTGMDQPSVAGLIVGMTICRPDGEIVRIDASNHPDFETIRASHLGLFGVVISVEVQCIKAAKLQCVMEARSINQLIGEIESGLFRKNSYVSVLYIPTYDKQDELNQKNVIIYRWEPVPLDVKDTNYHPELRRAEQEFSIKMNDLFNIPGFLAEHGHLIPFFMKYLVARMEVGTKDSISVGPWYGIVHDQAAFPWDIDDADFLFSDEQCKKMVTAITFINERLAAYAEKNQYVLTDGVYIRSCKGTNGGVSTSTTTSASAQTTCVDMVSCPKVPGYLPFKAESSTFFIDKLEAKPHWGKSVPLDVDYRKMYGAQFTEFTNALTRWYTDCGLSLDESYFCNSFFRSILQLTPIPQLTQTVCASTECKAETPMTSRRKLSNAVQAVIQHMEDYPHDSEHAINLKEQLKTVKQKCQPANTMSDKQRKDLTQAIGCGKAPGVTQIKQDEAPVKKNTFSCCAQS